MMIDAQGSLLGYWWPASVGDHCPLESLAYGSRSRPPVSSVSGEVRRSRSDELPRLRS